MRSIPIFLGLALMGLACRVLSLPIDAVNAPPGGLLFQDDFSDPASGWDRITDKPAGVLDYLEGSYHIYVTGRYQMLWASPGFDFKDVQIEVDVTNLNKSRDDNFGIICRAKDRDNFYFAVISSDGYYGIGKVKNGVQRLVDMPAMLPSEAIQQGKATNHLQVDCFNEEISLFINGVFLDSIQDADFISGDVGLAAGTFDEPGTQVLFDNFTVLKP